LVHLAQLDLVVRVVHPFQVYQAFLVVHLILVGLVFLEALVHLLVLDFQHRLCRARHVLHQGHLNQELQWDLLDLDYHLFHQSLFLL